MLGHAAVRQENPTQDAAATIGVSYRLPGTGANMPTPARATETEGNALGDIINLREARKARTRRERERQGAENRARHGQTKVERERSAIEDERNRRTLEGHRRGDPRDKPDEPA